MNKKIFVKIGLLLCTAICCFTLGIANVSTNVQASEIANFKIVDGASVRSEAPYGLRFSADYSKALFVENSETITLKDGYEAGILLVRTQTLQGELVKETEGAKDVKALVWGTIEDDENNYRLNAVLTDIPETEFGTFVTARAYLKAGDNIIYSQSVTRNVAQVASIAMTKGYVGEVFENYIDNVNPQITLPQEVDAEGNVTLNLGESITFAVTPEYLTATVISTVADIVKIENNTITAIKSGETQVTIKLGTLTKIINVIVSAPAVTTRTASSALDFTYNGEGISYITKAPSFATFDGVSVAQGSVSSTLVYDKSEATRTGLIFKGSFENNMTNLEDSTAEYGAWATGAGAQYYMFYIEMQSGTLLLYKTTGTSGIYIETTPLEKAGEAYRNKFNSGATEFELKATYCLNENGGLIIKLYIDNELQLWFEDASPLQGSSVGFCSTKANTEFKNFKYNTNVTLDMGSPIVSTHIAFTVSKGASGEYNTYKGWTNSRSIAYLNEVWLDKSIESRGKVSTNITPNGTKNAIILFASTNTNSLTGVDGIHFVLEPAGEGYSMYIACVRGANVVVGELGAGATNSALPVATTYGVEIEYLIQANKDIYFTYTITVGENTYVRTALWPVAWDTDAYWSRNNFNSAVAIWQEAGGNSVVFGDVKYEGNKGIYALNATLDKSFGASGNVEMDVMLGGTDIGVAMFGKVTPTSMFGGQGVMAYISATSGAVNLYFMRDANCPSVLVADAKVNVLKAMHIVYGYSIDGSGICSYSLTITQEGETPVVMTFTASTAPVGNYWNQNNLGDSVIVYYQPDTIGSPKVENFVYTQN